MDSSNWMSTGATISFCTFHKSLKKCPSREALPSHTNANSMFLFALDQRLSVSTTVAEGLIRSAVNISHPRQQKNMRLKISKKGKSSEITGLK